MCTWITENTPVEGSAKGPIGDGDWFHVTRATVYFDHPQHAPFDHSLNIDLVDEAAGPSARIGLELSAASARALVASIEATLRAAEEAHALA